MQDPSKDPILREYLMGGMRTNRDIRMILDVHVAVFVVSSVTIEDLRDV